MRRLIFLALLLPGCHEFRSIEADGRCGNGVVEPLADEDCDRFAPDGARCGAAGSTGACRFTCAEDARCPDGWGCGLDGVCRAPAGALTVHESVPAAGAVRVADIDADGRQDLVAVGSTSVTVAFGDPEARFSSRDELPVPTVDVEPAVVDLDGDGAADLAAPFALGLQLFRGGERQGLSPVALPVGAPPADLVDRQTMGLAVDARGDLAVVFLGRAEGRVVLDVYERGRVVVPGVPGERPLLPRQGVSSEGGPSLLALALGGAPAVWLVELACDGAECAAEVVEELPLPNGLRVAPPGVFFADFDLGDGEGERADLLVVGEGERRVPLVARRGPDGFEPLAPRPELTPAVNCQRCPGGDASALLAVRDLDGDGVADLVTRLGIWLTKPGQPPQVQLVAEPTRPWGFVVTADVNDDGRFDVVGARPDTIDLFLGNPAGGFNELFVPTNGEPSQLVTGDFDGDLAPDIAYVEGGGAVVALFSGRQRVPTERVLMANIPRLETLLPGDFGADRDNLTDLVLVSSAAEDAPGRIYRLEGTSARRMLSPVPRAGRVYSTINLGRFGPDHEPELLIGEAFMDGVKFRSLDPAPALAGQAVEPRALAWAEDCPVPRFAHMVKAVGDFDGDGRDTLALVEQRSPVGPLMERFRLWLVEREGDTLQCWLPVAAESADVGPGGLRIIDLDDDGALDVALVFNARGGRPELRGRQAPEMAVWWGREGSPPLEETPQRVVLGDAPVDTFELTPLRVVDTPGTSLLLWSPGQLVPVRFEGRTPLLGEALPGPQTVENMATLDGDGDGVDDLALATGDELLIYLQASCGARAAAEERCTRSAP